MARINKLTVVLEATDAARRLHVVSEDPAVIKAAKQAQRDVVQAVKSCGLLGGELNAAWSRSA